MDELSILRARVTMLERQMEELREFTLDIRARLFHTGRSYPGLEEEDEEVE